jgi:hypothetical protein
MALPITPEQQEMCRQAIRKHLTMVADPGGPLTPAQKLQSLKWFSSIVANMAPRRRDPVVKDDVTS